MKSPQKTPRVTASSIARQLGVSQPVVSSVLGNGALRVGAELAGRIRKTAAEAGYRPNAAARAIVTGRFSMVTLLLSIEHYRSLLPGELLDGIIDALTRRQYHLSLAKCGDAELTKKDGLPHVFRAYMCDGLLINYNADIPMALVRHVKSSGLPAIWLNTKQPSDCVYHDDFDAGRTAAQKLLEAGHCRTAFVNLTGAGHYSATDRREGFLQTIQNAGATCDVFETQVAGWGTASAAAAMTLLRKRRGRPTAVATYTTWEARACVTAARQVGLDVPGELSIVTFGLDPLDYLDLDVTTLRIDERRLGEQAVDALFKRMERPGEHVPAAAVPAALHPGVTLAPPRKRNS